MADKKAQQRKRAREKKRLRRQGRSRQSRNPRDAVVASDAHRWDLAAAYLDETWSDAPSHCWAVLARRHADGRQVVARYELDLARRALLSAETVVTRTKDASLAMAAELSEKSGNSLHDVPPGWVARVLGEVRRATETRGEALPEGARDALLLMSGIVEADLELAEPEAVTATGAAPKAWWRRLFG